MAIERDDLIERLRKRAEAEREIQRNNEAVAEALAGQLEAFHRHDGSHNTFAVRLGLQHRSCAKKDASLAADWDEAASTIAAHAATISHLEAEVEAMAEFIRDLIRDTTWCGCDLDGGEVQDRAQKAGFLTTVPFDPAVHSSHDTWYSGINPGDDWTTFAGPLAVPPRTEGERG